MFFVPIALSIVVIGLLQFFGWVMPSCVRIDIVVVLSITKMQYAMFHMKVAMNREPEYAITSILSMK